MDIARTGWATFRLLRFRYTVVVEYLIPFDLCGFIAFSAGPASGHSGHALCSILIGDRPCCPESLDARAQVPFHSPADTSSSCAHCLWKNRKSPSANTARLKKTTMFFQ